MTPRLAVLPARTLPDGLRLAVASRFTARLRGLAGLAAIGADEGLELPRCRSVHTVGMRFALDLVWLGRDGSVLRVDGGVAPWRMRSCRAASAPPGNASLDRRRVSIAAGVNVARRRSSPTVRTLTCLRDVNVGRSADPARDPTLTPGALHGRR